MFIFIFKKFFVKILFFPYLKFWQPQHMWAMDMFDNLTEVIILQHKCMESSNCTL